MKTDASDRKFRQAIREWPVYQNGVPPFPEFAESSAHDPSKYGIASRVFGAGVPEMIRFIVLGLRTSWQYFLLSPETEWSALWHHTIWAYAINDTEFVERTMSLDFQGFSRTGPYPPYYPLISSLFFAVARNEAIDESSFRQLADRKSLSREHESLVRFLWAVHTANAELALDSLRVHLLSCRKLRHVDPAYKLFNIMTHGLFELALRQKPDLMSGWETAQDSPWDSELYSWLRLNESAMSQFRDTQLSTAGWQRLSFPEFFKGVDVSRR